MKQKIINLGAFLVDLLKLDQTGKGKQGLQKEIMVLSAGRKPAVREYYVRKVLIFMTIVLAGGILSLLCLAFGGNLEQQVTLETLLRPDYGEGDRTEEVSVQIEGEELQELEVTVQARKYTDQEKQDLLDQAVSELDAVLPGQNESLDSVRTSLSFPESLADGTVTASYTTTPYGVIAEDGSILEAENESGTLVQIQVLLECGGREVSWSAAAMVYPPERSAQEQLLYDLKEELELADEKDSYSSELALPSLVNGKKVTWLQVSENPFMTVFAMSLLTAVFFSARMDSRIHEKAEARRTQLLLDYPDLMWKLTMLLGAGMSIKGAFTRISQEYLRGKTRKNGKKGKKTACRYIYEEVSYTCYEMQSGIGEAEAYERFGRRCQSPEYIRIGSVLSQNLRKGAKGLTGLLEKEAESSLNDRKNHARKIGEQAGTKLLLPMALMLGVILAVLTVPAFLNF